MNYRGVRQSKRRVPVTHSPDSKAFGYALVLTRNPHGEYLATILRMMYLTIFPHKVGTEDQPHASSFTLRKMNFTHNGISLLKDSWQATIRKAMDFLWAHIEGSDYHVNYVLKEFEKYMKK